MNTANTSAKYRLAGMDCTSCGTKIEKAARGIRGVTSAAVSMGTQTLTVETDDSDHSLPEVEKAVESLGYKISRVGDRPAPGASSTDDDDDAPKDFGKIDPSYRRALALVVALNAGYGVVELVAGVVARSQALKADALDFVGDGLITFFGLLAAGWGLTWRARSALIQGVFLGFWA